MLALHLLWLKLVRPLVLIIGAIHFIEAIVDTCKKIAEYKEGITAGWPIAITVVWTLGNTLGIVGRGTIEGFCCALIAIPLAEWPIILLLASLRFLRLQRLSLFSAATRARAYLDDGGTQVTLSLIGSVGGMIFVMVSEWGTITRVPNAPAAFEIDQLGVYVPGLAVIVLCFVLGVMLYIRAIRFAEPYRKDLEERLTGRAAVAVAPPEVVRNPASGQIHSE